MMDSSRESEFRRGETRIIKIVQNGILNDVKGFKFKPQR
jgi:hypothetical protein